VTDFKERRSYFRIEDVIGLNYCLLEQGEEFCSTQPGDAVGPFRRLLDEIDVAFNRAANTIWQRDPATAQALGLLNRKLDLIAEQCPPREELPLEHFDEQTASISGSGLAFTTSKPYPVSARLGIALVLKPSHIKLRFTARVVACEPMQEVPNELYLLRIEIDDSNESVREQLVQHVVQKQCNDLNADDTEGAPETDG